MRSTRTSCSARSTGSSRTSRCRRARMMATRIRRPMGVPRAADLIEPVALDGVAALTALSAVVGSLKCSSVRLQFASVDDRSRDGRPSATEVGTQLRLLRRARRQTLKDVAERAGVSESFLSQLERGARGPASRRCRASRRRSASRSPTCSRARAADRAERAPADDRPYVSWGTFGRKALLTPKPFEALEVVAAVVRARRLDRGGAVRPRRLRGAAPRRRRRGRADAGRGDDAAPGRRLRPLPELDPAPGRQYRRGAAEVIYVISPPSY